jgi:glycosyltransferase involved in cell wall biosynthesis
MYKEQKIVVVMPAYNAAQTLHKTWDEVMAQEIVDLVVLIDGDMGMSHENMYFTTC